MSTAETPRLAIYRVMGRGCGCGRCHPGQRVDILAYKATGAKILDGQVIKFLQDEVRRLHGEAQDREASQPKHMADEAVKTLLHARDELKRRAQEIEALCSEVINHSSYQALLPRKADECSTPNPPPTIPFDAPKSSSASPG